MARSLEARIAELEGKCMAYEALLCDLIHHSWPLEQHRLERRDSACRAIEYAMGLSSPSHEHHHAVQTMLATVEEVFGNPAPRPDEPTP